MPRRPFVGWCFASAAFLFTVGCSRPDFLELAPSSVAFERVGESKPISVIGKNRQGITFPKLRVAWESHDPAVVSVDRGIIKAVGHGHTVVEVKTDTGLTAELPVSVILVDKVVANKKTLEFAMDGVMGSEKIEVTAYDRDGREVRNRVVHAQCKDTEVCNSTGDTVFRVNPGKTTLEISVDNVSTTIPVVIVEHVKELDKLHKQAAK